MKLTRRGLVAAGLGSPLAVRVGAAQAAPATFGGPGLLPPDRIGIQLYTVRDQVDAIGFSRVFAALAEMGYKKVEFAGYTQGTGAITLAQLKQLLDANGLIPIGSHLSFLPGSDAEMQQALTDAQALGIPQVGVSLVVPTSGTTVAGWKSFASTCNRYGQFAAARGMGFYLHNHFQEWAPCTDDPTRRGHDVLLAECDPAYVFFELDIYWASVGQAMFGSHAPFTFDPLLDYAIPNRNRYRLWHVKDGRRNQSSPQGYDIIECGQGHIDFERFFCAVGQLDSHEYLHENDNASNHHRGSLASAQVSYIWMRHGIQGC